MMVVNIKHLLGKPTGAASTISGPKGSMGQSGPTGPSGYSGSSKMGFSVSTAAKYEVATILAALNKFKDLHVEDYTKAMATYRSDVIKRLNVIKANVEKAIQEQNDGKEFNGVEAFVTLTKPVNCEKEYAKLINLFSSMADSVVELEFDDADSLLNDDWPTITQAKTTNSFYNNR